MEPVDQGIERVWVEHWTIEEHELGPWCLAWVILDHILGGTGGTGWRSGAQPPHDS